MIDGYAELWAAVFAQAIRDACETENVRSPAKSTSAAPTARDVSEAWQFLTDLKGEWGSSRDFWASMNGLNPDVVREAALHRGLSRAARVALLTGECTAPKRERPEVVRLPRAAVKARNEALLAEYVAGVPTRVLAEKYGVRPATVLTITGRAGVHRTPEVLRRMGVEAAAKGHAHLAGRNAEILERAQRGQRPRDIARQMGISDKAVHGVLNRRKAASAVEVRGDSNSRAGGGACLSPFHGENHTQGSAT